MDSCSEMKNYSVRIDRCKSNVVMSIVRTQWWVTNSKSATNYMYTTGTQEIKSQPHRNKIKVYILLQVQR